MSICVSFNFVDDLLFLILVTCLQYFVLVIVIFVLETIASVLAFVYRIEIENTVKKQLLYVIKEKWSATDEEGWREGWAYTHETVINF